MATTRVPNPAIIGLRLTEPTLGAYLHLSHALTAAANDANDRAVAAREVGNHDAYGELLTVRDALRVAATNAMLNRGDRVVPPCRVCGTECATCAAPAATS
jgi:hypothetical protein